MAYVGQPTLCGHEDVIRIPGTDLVAVRTCTALLKRHRKPEHMHRYGGFVLRLRRQGIQGGRSS